MGSPPADQNAATEPVLTRRQVRLLGYLALAVGLGWLLYRCRTVFPIFLLGFLLAYIFDPILDALQSKGWGRVTASIVVFGVLTIVFALLALFLVPVVVGQVQSLALNYDSYAGKLGDLSAGLERYLARLNVSDQTIDSILGGWRKVGGYAINLAPRVGSWLVGSLSSLLVLLILPIVTFYFMQEIDPLRARLRSLLPADYAEDIVSISGDINRMLGRYIRGQTTVCVLVGIVTTVVLLIYAAIFKMKYALLLGIVAGATYVIPFLGATLAAVGAGIVGYVTTDNSWLCAVLVVLTMMAVNQVFDNVVTPKIVGESIGLHPLTVIFALMAGGTVAGILGMLIAVPAAASIKVLLVHVLPKLRERPPPQPIPDRPPEPKEPSAPTSAEAGEPAGDRRPVGGPETRRVDGDAGG